MAYYFRFLFYSLFLSFSISTLCGQSINPDQSTVNFEVSNFGMGSVDGAFSGMKGNITFDANELSNATFEVCIDAKSIDTGNNKRDGHLKGEDFFDVEKYPTICFSSNEITKTKDGFKATGTLNMHGISKSEEIIFTYRDGIFTGDLTVNRKDYKIGPSGGFMVGKEVKIQIVCKTVD